MLRVIKFTLLTIWIVFISRMAQISYSPDVIFQSDLVAACMMEAKKKKKIDPAQYIHTYIYRAGGYYEVLLEKSHKSQNYVLCGLDLDGNVDIIQFNDQIFSSIKF